MSSLVRAQLLWHVACMGFLGTTLEAKQMNGFDLEGALIPMEAILSGGPPRDGIPSIDNPKFITAEKARFLRDDDIIIGLVRDGQARAYPLRILVWHEVVNDTFAGQPVAVTYCPLCATAMVFGRQHDGRMFEFGVSGLLYHSDVLLYDRQTESLWSQLQMQAVTGPHKGTKLAWLASQQMTWKAWRTQNPDTEVLSTDTGHRRNYRREAYRDYARSEGTLFPVPFFRDEVDLRLKDLVIGFIVDDTPFAFPVDALEDHTPIKARLGRVTFHLEYDPAARHARITNLDTDEPIPTVQAYWFAWQAFYPGTGVWTPAETGG